MNADKIIWNYRQQFRGNAELCESYTAIGWTGREEIRWRISSRGWDFINSTYYECTTVLGIEMEKEWYKDYLVKEHCWNPYRKTKQGYWARRWAARKDAREKSNHYVRRPHHKKKELSEHEIAKREWRKKKFKRQDEKRNFRASPYFKILNKKSHRAFERECINTFQTWKLHDRTWKYAEDPWSWD